MLHINNKVLKVADKIQDIINFFCLASLVFLVILQILLRYVFKLPLLGIEEMMMYPTIWLFMMGGASASLKNEHIECGMLDSLMLSKNVTNIINLVKHTASVIVSGMLCFYTFPMAQYSLKLWKTSGTLYIPMFYAEVSIFIGIVLMFLYSLFHLYNIISNRIREGK